MSGYEWLAGALLCVVLMRVIAPVLSGCRESGMQGVLRNVALLVVVLIPAVALLLYQRRGEREVTATGEAG